VRHAKHSEREKNSSSPYLGFNPYEFLRIL
jgi:hypothetical protein